MSTMSNRRTYVCDILGFIYMYWWQCVCYVCCNYAVCRLSQYFHGNHHLEEIMLIENIARSQLLTLIDKFSEVLVTCSLSQNTPPLLKDN